MDLPEKEERTMAVMLVATIMALCWAVANEAHCEPTIHYAAPAVFHAACHGADYWSSVTSNGQEVGLAATRIGLPATKALGFALTYGADLGIQRLQGPHKWPVRVYRIVLGAGYAALVAHNRRVR